MKVIIKTDGLINPIQITNTRPYFSFYFDSAEQNVKVESYRLVVSDSTDFENILFDTNDVNSNLTQNIPYTGENLEYGKVYYVLVVGKTNVGDFESDITTFETPLKNLGGDWLKRPQGATDGLPIFATDFVVKDTEIKRARLYLTALGVFEPWLNGEEVGDNYLAPGYTDYKYEVPYETYDITGRLQAGKNNICVYTGNGWYAGRVLHKQFNYYGKTPLIKGEIMVEYEDGTVETFATNKDWMCIKHSPYRFTDNFDGEIFDARLAGDFSAIGYEYSDWLKAEVATDANAETTNGVVLSKIKVVPDKNAPTKSYAKLSPVASFYNDKEDVTVFDLGQNFGGTARFLLKGTKGTAFKFRYAEMLDGGKGGTPTMYVDNLRSAKATDEYIKGTDDPEVYEPKFTFHGYRYVEVSGKTVTEDDVMGIAFCSYMPRTGTIETGVENVNKLFSNILWGQRSNYISIPTDCPQRDERGGWMGDAEVFCGTAVYNFDVQAFMNKYIQDLITGQNRTSNKSFPDWAPMTNGSAVASPAWGDAGTIIPARMYEVYGDKRVLQNSLSAMINWANCLKKETEWNGILYGHSYGDWLSVVDSPRMVTDTAFYAHTLDLISKCAAIIGDHVTECKYNDEFERVKAIYNKKFVTKDFHVYGNTQTVYCLTVAFNLVDSIEGRKTMVKRIVADVQKNGNKITGGFIGISYINKILSEYGYGDVAYNLLLQTEYPSWIYPILQGATTIWERWNSYTHTNGFGDVRMNSFNHYSMGAVGEWMYEYMLGIRSKDGFKTMILTPSIDERMGYVKGSYSSPYGKITAGWKVVNGTLTYKVSLPCNTSARLVLPVCGEINIRGKAAVIASSNDFETTIDLPSGNYEISGDFVPTITKDMTSLVDYTDDDVKKAYFKSEVKRGAKIARKWVKDLFKK